MLDGLAAGASQRELAIAPFGPSAVARVLAGMRNRVILGERRVRFLKQRQEPAVTSALWAHDRSAAAVESRRCLARARDRSAEQASTKPEIRENASITRKRRIWIPINTRGWPPDSAFRAQLRYLVQKAKALMEGEYRSLVSTGAVAGGRPR